jgi:transporter family-2 protein
LTRFGFIAAALIVGILIALQARINGQLSTEVGSGLQAALISFGSGLVVLSAIALLLPRVRAGFGELRTAVRTGSLPVWQLFGGLIGGFFVAVQSATVPVIGVAIFTVAVVAGQSANSLIVDRIGLGPAGKQPINRWRVTSALLAIIAVVLAVSDRLTATTAIIPVVFALLAGVLIAVQQAINGRVSRAAGSPTTAAWVNFMFGSLGLGAALGVAVAFLGAPLEGLPSGPWWIYAGGVIGVIFIAMAAWLVPIIGVLLFALVSIAGQLIGSLALDLLLPTEGSQVTATLIAGLALALLAVLIAARAGGRRFGHRVESAAMEG